MLRKRSFILGSALLALLVFVSTILYIFRPHDVVNVDLLAPELIKLGENPKVEGYYYIKDGGSILVYLSGDNGEKLVLSMPSIMGEEYPNGAYKAIIVGDLYDPNGDFYELKDPQHTRLRLLELLRDYKITEYFGRSKDEAIAISSGRLSDRIIYWCRENVLFYYEDQQ